MIMGCQLSELVGCAGACSNAQGLQLAGDTAVGRTLNAVHSPPDLLPQGLGNQQFAADQSPLD